MNALSTRTRVTLGLVCLLVSVLLIGMMLGVVPDHEKTVVDGRRGLCEAVAVSTSILVSHHDATSVRAMLEDAVRRNKDVLSAGLRRRDGRLLIDVNDHATRWRTLPDDHSTETQMQVPIRDGQQRWGTLEICFCSPKPAGTLGRWLGTGGVMVVFVVAASALLFMVYLRKILEYLDPSQVVPPHVRSALDTLAEGLLIIDSRGRIVLANRAFAALLEKRPDQLLGVSAAELPWIHDGLSARRPAELPWTSALARKTAVTNVTVHMQTAGDEVRTFLVNAAPVLGHKGEYRGALASFEDITPLELKERELRSARDFADAANRTKSEFLANMSHDIRTPMNTILGFTDVIRRGLVGSEREMRRYLDTIHSSGKHLLELINDILDLSKIEAGRLEIERRPCDVLALMAESVEMFRIPARTRGLSLELTTAGPVPATVHTDPTRLRQIITNLVGNAIKFTEKGGVKIVARLLSESDKPLLAIDVADTGVGIPERSLAKIFDPFVQADSSVTRRFGGTGLGLAISRRFAEALGGELTVKSVEGQGSTFTVAFDPGPLQGVEMLDDAGAQGRMASTATVAAGVPKLPSARILVADDGEANLQLISVILTRAGLQVHCVANGAAAVRAAESEAFDLVLMDMQMPVMDGYTATQRLRQQGMTLPIVALTANAMKGDEEKCLAAGCSGFLAKPVDIDQLLRCIAEQLHVVIDEARTAETPSPQDEAQRLLKQQLNAMVVAWQNRDFNALVEQIGSLQTTSAALQDDEIRVPAARLETLLATRDAEGIESAIEVLAVRIESRALERARFAEHSAAKLADDAAGCQRAGGCRPLVSRLSADDPEFRPIVEGFVQRLRAQVAAMHAARAQSNLPELKRLAHWLKGAGGTMGFDPLTQPAALLEESAKDGIVEEIETTLAMITDLVDSIVIPPSNTSCTCAAPEAISHE